MSRCRGMAETLNFDERQQYIEMVTTLHDEPFLKAFVALEKEKKKEMHVTKFEEFIEEKMVKPEDEDI